LVAEEEVAEEEVAEEERERTYDDRGSRYEGKDYDHINSLLRTGVRELEAEIKNQLLNGSNPNRTTKHEDEEGVEMYRIGASSTQDRRRQQPIQQNPRQ
jgi:hypothetical protein